MTDPVKRLNYFNGQFLREDDFRDEQSYHRGMRQLHNQSLHTYGITRGLKLTSPSGATQVTVGQGSAIDGQGRELVLPDDFPTQDLSTFAGHSTLFVTIAYAEQLANKKSEGGVTDSTRVEERPTINVAAAAPDDASLTLILGRVTIDQKGVLQSIDNSAGTGRRTAGAVGGDLNVVSLTLADPGVASALWPRFTATTAGRVDLAGSLKLTGGLDATGGSGIITDNLEVRRQMTVDAAAQLKGGLDATGGSGITTDNLEVRKQITVDGVAQLKGGLTVTAGAVQVSGTGAKLDVTGPTFLHGGDFELRDAGDSDTTAVRLFSINGSLYLQNGGGGNIIFRSKTAAANVFVQDNGGLTVGPLYVPSTQGRITASGAGAEIGFVRRNLTVWPASPAAGDRYWWHTDDGSQASLSTEVNGDLLTVTKNGDLFTKGTIHSGGGLTVTAGAVQVSGTGAKLDVTGPTFLHGGDFELRDAGESDKSAVRLFSIGGSLYLQNGGGNNIVFRSKTAQENVFVQDDGKVGIGVSGPQAQLHVATDMAVGPLKVPAGYQGYITASGALAQIGFTRRNLAAWPVSPASPQAGDRYWWHTDDGSQASLSTEVNGDVLRVTKDGDLFTKGRIHPGLTNILYVQTSSSFSNLSTIWASVPNLTLTLPAGPGSAIIILNVPNPYATGATGDVFPGAMFGLSIDGTVSPQFTSFTYSDKNPANPARVPATLVIVVPLNEGATQLIRALWKSVGASYVHIDPPASLTAIIA
jgi:hypothetical protein